MGKKATDTKCKGGFNRDLKLLTKSKSKEEAEEFLQAICDDALDDAIDAAKDETHDWSMLEAAPASIDLEEYYNGQGILNDETGNFQQTTSRFLKRPAKMIIMPPVKPRTWREKPSMPFTRT